jgi:hypothetical protein
LFKKKFRDDDQFGMMTKLPDGMANRGERTMIPEDKRPVTPTTVAASAAEYDVT